MEVRRTEVSDGAVEVTVWDSEPRLPIARAADPDRVGQHGLEIVMAVCRSFEVHRAPVACVAVTVGFVAWRRARASAGDLADLVEATVDLHAVKLAGDLGFPSVGQMHPLLGQQITELLRKGA